jgi:hypothetical protein
MLSILGDEELSRSSMIEARVVYLYGYLALLATVKNVWFFGPFHDKPKLNDRESSYASQFKAAE